MRPIAKFLALFLVMLITAPLTLAASSSGQDNVGNSTIGNCTKFVPSFTYSLIKGKLQFKDKTSSPHTADYWGIYRYSDSSHRHLVSKTVSRVMNPTIPAKKGYYTVCLSVYSKKCGWKGICKSFRVV